MSRWVTQQIGTQRHAPAERSEHVAQDGRPTRSSWSDIGARILTAAALSTAVHLAERARQRAEPARRELELILDAAK